MSDISIKMKLDGESDFRRAVKDCNSELKNMQSELKKVDAESQGQANSLDALTDKYKALEKVQESAAKKTETLGEIVDKVKAKRDSAREELEKLRESESASVQDIEKAENAYRSAESSLNTWQKKLNDAQTEEINLNRQLEQTGTYLEEARSSADGCATSIDEYGKKTNKASENTDQLLNVMSKTAAMEAIKNLAEQVSGTMTKLGDAAHDAMIELDAGYDTIIKKTGASGETLEQFKGIANNIFGRLPVDMDLISNAIGEVNTRFGLTGEALEKVSESFVKFAKVNDTDVTSAVDDVQNALSAFGLSAASAEEVLNVLTTTGQKTGANVGNLSKKLTENATAFKEMGMNIYEATDFMGKLETAGADSSSVLSGLKRALKSATEQGKPLTTALDELEDSIKNGTDSMDGLSVAYDLFGKSGAGVFEAVRNGQISFKDLASETDILNEATNRLDETFEGTLDAWDQWTVAQNNLKEVGGELSAEFYEAMTPAINSLTGIVQDATTAFRELPEPMQDVLGIAGGLTVEAGKLAPQLFEVGSSLATIAAAKQGIKALQSLPGVTSSAATLAGKLSGALAALGNPVVLAGIAAVVAGIVIAKNSIEDLGQDVDTFAAEVAGAAGEAASEIDLYRVSVQNAGTAQDKFAEANEAYAKAQASSKKATEDLTKIQDKEKSLLEDTRKEVNESSSGWVKAAKAVGAFGGANVEGALIAGEYADSMTKLNEAQTAAQESVTQTTEAEREFIGQMGEAVSAMEADNEMTRGVTNGTIELAEAYGYANGTAGEAIEALGNLSLAHQQTREQIQAEIDTINTKMQELQAEYDAAYESAYNSLSGQFGLFQQVTLGAIPSVDELTAALDSQMQFMVDYGTNLQKAAEMGVSEGLIKELSDGSVESAQYLQAIVDGGEEKVGELNKAWEKTENGKKAFAKVLAEQQTDFNNRMSALESRMNTAVNNLNKADAAYISGAQTIQGYIRGSESYRSAIIAEYTSLGNAATQAFNAAVKIKSPSKVFYESGVYTMEGAIQGAESMRDNLMDTYESLALASIAAFNPAAYRSDIGRYTGSQNINNQVAVYIGDKELTGIMAQGVIKNISAQQRNGYAGIRR